MLDDNSPAAIQALPTPPAAAPTSNGVSAGLTVAGIGASAGGLEACRRLLDGLSQTAGLACIFVQHLDPAHGSLLVSLLAPHTTMTVLEAASEMPVAAGHLYVSPPGFTLAVSNGVFVVSSADASRHTHRPIDVMLTSLAEQFGTQAIGVVLSGNGEDGSAGVQAIHRHGGRVIVQDPVEAAYDSMPRSALTTGPADLVLQAALIGDALSGHPAIRPLPGVAAPQIDVQETVTPSDELNAIVELLRCATPYDFRLYKTGTLRRRIERRLAAAALPDDALGPYLVRLQHDPIELGRLADDLLINITRFFRDPDVFDTLAESVLPRLLDERATDQPLSGARARPLRLWVAGCSTGEETYSLAILLSELISQSGHPLRVQIFASDIDRAAIDSARTGFYPLTIEADISAARLSRFFTREDHGYRVLPELRAMIVFAVQDILVDPPFACMDMVSCRNVLIYLGAAAQAKVMSMFHFALREDGVLLLGHAETVGETNERFEAIERKQRIYRHRFRARPGELAPLLPVADAALPEPTEKIGQQASLAELCRRSIIDAYAPAAILIDGKRDCLYSVGPTDVYLRVVVGHPSRDLLAMLRHGLQVQLGPALEDSARTGLKVVVDCGRIEGSTGSRNLQVEILPVGQPGDRLRLVCFIEQPEAAAPRLSETAAAALPAPDHGPGHDVETSLRAELQAARLSLEQAREERRAISEEALSVGEEYQSTNEELLASKEELQSFNEELTALNSQLQETLERQRTTSTDLQNILYSTDVATLFLDTSLRIRFFTPATRALFNIIGSDVGRPLADLHALAADAALLDDAQRVMGDQEPLEREVATGQGAWFNRRILPYRNPDRTVQGVVITFSDITERKHAAHAIEAAREQAEVATLAKSRFLAIASHDLRQPLQTLSLLQGLLTGLVTGSEARAVVERLAHTLSGLSGMLDTLLDINRIEAGTIPVRLGPVDLGSMLARLQGELATQAGAQGLGFRVVPCSLTVRSDPQLLEQMLRNLLSNALRYTSQGRILLGCRRRPGIVSVEVWDTGVGIADDQLSSIFDEYRQVGNPARERRLGLGLGLSIVARLAELLGHQIRVTSRLGHGSCFAIEVAHDKAVPAGTRPARLEPPVLAFDPTTMRPRAVLLVEDDNELRSLLTACLTQAGYAVTAAVDGVEALALVAATGVEPDLLLSDFSLPRGISGLTLALTLRERLRGVLPVIILTGDISTQTLRAIADERCTYLTKPATPAALIEAVGHILGIQPLPPAAETNPDEEPDVPGETTRALISLEGKALIYVVDDDGEIRADMRRILQARGYIVRDFASCEEFLSVFHPGQRGCLLLDGYLPGMDGLALLAKLHDLGDPLPTIMITGFSDVPFAVRAMKSGASDFISKPFTTAELLRSVQLALDRSGDEGKLQAWHEEALGRIAGLTERQHEIMTLVLAGHPSKNIAADIGISQRTVENHRASIMKRTGTRSLPELARLALAATRVSLTAGPTR